MRCPRVDKLARYTQEAFDGLADSLLAPVIVKSQRKLVAHDRTLASTKPAPRLKSIARGSVLKRATARCVSRRQGRE
jgi:hypothetical protein